MNQQLERLQAITEAYETLAKLFYRMELQKAFQSMEEATSNLIGFVEGVRQERDVEAERLQDINQLLELMMNCVSNQDYLLVADLMRYELCPRLQQLAVA